MLVFCLFSCVCADGMSLLLQSACQLAVYRVFSVCAYVSLSCLCSHDVHNAWEQCCPQLKETSGFVHCNSKAGKIKSGCWLYAGERRPVRVLLKAVGILAISGATAGLLGIGGALIFNPYLLQLGMDPRVSPASKT